MFFKKSHYAHIPSYMFNTHSTLGNEKEQQQIKFQEKSSGELIFLWATNLNSDKMLKFMENIKFQVKAKSYIKKISTEVLILQRPSETCSESSQTLDMKKVRS